MACWLRIQPGKCVGKCVCALVGVPRTSCPGNAQCGVVCDVDLPLPLPSHGRASKGWRGGGARISLESVEKKCSIGWADFVVYERACLFFLFFFPEIFVERELDVRR